MNKQRTIGMIGAGPGSLNVAKVLVDHDFHIEIYDTNDYPGGAVYTGIPEYRMNKSFIDKLYTYLKEKGVVFHFNCTVGKDIAFKDLVDKYDRVLVAIGAQVENMFNLEAKDGCEAGLTLLYDLNILHKHDEYKRKYKKALVWGGGNVAMDCARSLVRIFDDVSIIYRRSENEITASRLEIRDARNEGVKLLLLKNIKEVIRDDNQKIRGVKCIEMELGEPDSSGRASSHEVVGSEFFLECDLLVAAIGQKVNFKVLDEDLDLINDKHKSTFEKVFIMGDAYLGPSTLALVVKDAKEVSQEILDSFIGG